MTASDRASVGLPKAAIPSWLLLQATYYQVRRKEVEAWFSNIYGGQYYFGNQPWVTWVRWNGKSNSLEKYFGPPFQSSADAITRWFGSEFQQPQPLPQDVLERYYSDPQSASVIANAVVLKYLVETIDRWFQTE